MVCFILGQKVAVLVACLSARGAAIETNQHQQERKRKSDDALAGQSAQVDVLETRKNAVTMTLQEWNSVLQAVTSLETHGSKKEAHQTWQNFIKDHVGIEFVDSPAWFRQDPPIAYIEFLKEVSGTISTLENEIQRLTASITKQRASLDTAMSRRNKKEEAARKKAEEKISGVDHTEENKTHGCYVNVFPFPWLRPLLLMLLCFQVIHCIRFPCQWG